VRRTVFDTILNAVSLGGDSDTIAAIAGGIAEAAFGVPDDIRAETHRRLPKDIQSIVLRFYERYSTTERVINQDPSVPNRKV
jgi:ADP-ribosylglycohydrolase